MRGLGVLMIPLTASMPLVISLNLFKSFNPCDLQNSKNKFRYHFMKILIFSAESEPFERNETQLYFNELLKK